MEIIIEKLKKKDLKEAVSLYDNTYSTITDTKKALKIFDEMDKNPLYHLVVAKNSSEIVGFAMLVKSYDIVENCKPFLSVWNFVVK